MTTDWIAKWSTYSSQKIALVETDTNASITYGELNQKAEQLVRYLSSVYNLKKGSCVAMLAEFSINTFVLFAAAQKAGFILVPINYRLTHNEVLYILEDSEPELVLFEEKYHALIEGTELHTEELSLAIKQVETLASTDIHTTEISINDPVFILYTSGTTGFPKGAIYTHKMMLWNSINTILRLQLNGSDSTLLCTPSFHTGGWNVLATPLLHVGGTIYIMPKFDVSKALSVLEKEKITLLMTVPTMTKMLMEHEDFAKTDFSAIRYYIVGGEALPIALIETWANKGVYIRQGYGLTEAGPNITSLPEQDAIRKRGSIGFVNFYIDSIIVDEEGNEVNANESGELWLRGDVVTPGYWKNEKSTAASFHQEWFKTGDVMRMDDEGYLYIVDRKKNMFISGGENVYPAEIEKELRNHSLIDEVGVIGVKDEKWGEVGLAYYTTFNGTPLTEEELKAYCLQRLAKYKIPKHFVHLSEMPKNDTGKLDKISLKKLHQQ